MVARWEAYCILLDVEGKSSIMIRQADGSGMAEEVLSDDPP